MLLRGGHRTGAIDVLLDVVASLLVADELAALALSRRRRGAGCAARAARMVLLGFLFQF